MTWECRTEPLQGGEVEHFIPQRDGAPLVYGEVLRLWREDARFRGFFMSLLASTGFPNYRWETPPITAATASRRFEFVLVDAPELACAADRWPFAEHFDRPDDAGSVVAVPNLRGDALLVIPLPLTRNAAYADLASFLRTAPEAQRHALWQTVGRSAQARLGDAPMWLSTAGAGVAWLHVRLDRRPKYYCFAPYRAWP